MSLRTLRQGDRGWLVRRMQQALIAASGDDEADCLGRPFPRGAVFSDDGDFGPITRQALLAYQQRQNLGAGGAPQQAVCDADTWRSLGFESGRAGSPSNSGPAAARSGGVGRQGRTRGTSRQRIAMPPHVMPPQGVTMPPWMAVAWREYDKGIYESPGAIRNNAQILEYLSVAHLPTALIGDRSNKNARDIMDMAERVDTRRAAQIARTGRGRQSHYVEEFAQKQLNEVDETPWCGCFVQWCLKEAGYTRLHPGRASARSWQTYGRAAADPSEEYGAVCVVRNVRNGRPTGYHVGFCVGPASGGEGVCLLGGNQAMNANKARRSSAHRDAQSVNWDLFASGGVLYKDYVEGVDIFRVVSKVVPTERAEDV